MPLQMLTERQGTESGAPGVHHASSGWTSTFTDPSAWVTMIELLAFRGPFTETGSRSVPSAHAVAPRAARG